jgi:hypothetical protein
MRFLTLIVVVAIAALCAAEDKFYSDAEKVDREREIGMSAGFNETLLTGCSYSATCSAGGIEGVCVSVSAGCCSGTKTSGLCPGSSDIQCCTNNKCTTPDGSGTCKQTSACSGSKYSGYCTGPSDVQCCVSTNPSPTPTSSSYGIDISSTLSASTASCLAGSKSFVIPRGYKSTGAVDTSVCTSITNAANAGFKTRDTYMFPCPTCSSSAASQMSQLTSYLNANCKSQWSGRIWLDIEGSQYWTGSTSNNQAWYKTLKDACKSSGAR